MARATTGVLFGGLTGKAGTVVFVRAQSGAVYVRPRVTPRNPQSPAQTAARNALAQATRVWRDLNDEEADAWAAYARGLDRALGPTASGAARRAHTVFSGLAVKLLQVDPESEVPRLPPAEAFVGDSVVVTVQPAAGPHPYPSPMPARTIRDGGGDSGAPSSFAAEGSCCENEEGVGGGDPMLPPLAPPSCVRKEPSGPHEGGGLGLVFTANGPNGDDVVTEFLTQRVGSLHSKGTPALLRTAGFHAFTLESLSATVEVPPGHYACAVRFVRPSTGQASGLIMLGTVRVSA